MGARPRLLDLFCGAGGCAVGYHRAGFEVVGVDIAPQPHYPFEFHRGDALEYLAAHGREFDAIHASPPCQRYSCTQRFRRDEDCHPDLIGETRQLLEATGKTWVIENVPGSPLAPYCTELCGLMFGLKIFRHRLFEARNLILSPPHPPHGRRRIGIGGFVCVAGNGGAGINKEMRARARKHGNWSNNRRTWSAAMGIDWMTRDELAQAIPPAYTEWVGGRLMASIGGETC